jgi:hypothetical protein
MDLSEQHWLDYRTPTPSGWVYACGCKREFRASHEDEAQRAFHDHLETERSRRRDTRTR